MEALFRLLEIRDGIAHVAEVGIRAQTADHDEILLSTSMFAWRREAHGPDAVMQLESDAALVREAIDGVQDGLERVSRDHGGGYRVTVTKIWESAVDTSPGDGAYSCLPGALYRPWGTARASKARESDRTESSVISAGSRVAVTTALEGYVLLPEIKDFLAGTAVDDRYFDINFDGPPSNESFLVHGER